MSVALDRLDDPAPHARLLSNGHYLAVITGAGTGYSAWNGTALTAWNADRTEDADGLFIYIRDLDAGTLWSLGHQPVQRAGGRYRARYRPGAMLIERWDDGIEARLEMCVAPNDALEVRRLRLHNRSSRPRRVEVTSYAEVVLADQSVHASHPSFSKLFVETACERGVLLARRRPRSATDHPVWMAHTLVGDGALEYETDRARFVGRGHTLRLPWALVSDAPLSGTVGSVLDPVFSLRRVVRLRPRDEAEVLLLLGAANTREQVLALVRRHARPGAAGTSFAEARSAELALLRRLQMTRAEAELSHELAGALLYGHPALGADTPRRRRARPVGGEATRARLGGPPLIVVDPKAGAAGRALERDASKAQAYLRAKGFEIDVVVSQRRTRQVSDEAVPNAGRAFVVLSRPLSALARELCPARPRRVRRPAGRRRVFRPRGEASVLVSGHEPSADSGDGSLLFENGYGGFTPDGREYLMRLDDTSAGPRRPPMPWVNVIANEAFGFLVSESGASCTWSRNSQANRLTPWYSDPIVDPHGEALYVRDEDAGTFWSPLPGPVVRAARYEVRHGFGYSLWRHTSEGLAQEVCLFVPRRDPVKVLRVTLTNAGARARRVSLFAYFRLVLGVLAAENARSVATALDAKSGALFAENPLNGEFADGVVFAAAVPPERAGRVRFSGDRTAFLGRNGTPANPAALRTAAALDGRTGSGLDPCAALQVPVTIAPGATVACAFLLGETTDRAAARALVGRYRRRGAVDVALEEVRTFWAETVSAVQVRTPSAALDLMVNGWLLYQNLSSRMWGRTAFYQSSGAFGFRDQLQDATALVYTRPDLTRAQILLHAAHQFVEGDVLHWWHPQGDRGTRTRFSDDLLWLCYVTAFYVRATRDRDVLAEQVRFVTARPLAAGEDEAYLRALPGERADLYEHCCRALDRSLTRGVHGLPLMGTGDWNDGMNRVGREGRGESVWLAFFLLTILGDFITICEGRGDDVRVRRYRDHRARLEVALEDAGWDGDWYRRAYYDDGTPLGSAAGEECRIDLLPQAWAVISKAAPRERATRAMAAAEHALVSTEARLIRLLAPPFDRTPHDPGYIKGYIPGIRENGGQYTHAALWAVRAFAELGRRERALALLEMLGPIAHTRTAADVAIYKVEPYVVAADVYGVPPHVGRGGWTWYTGSAGWMYRVALESVLGLTLEGGDELRLAPCVPDDWPGYDVTLRLPDRRTSYAIEVRNPSGSSAVVTCATLDGAPVEVVDGVARIPLRRDQAAHRVSVTLGTP